MKMGSELSPAGLTEEGDVKKPGQSAIVSNIREYCFLIPVIR